LHGVAHRLALKSAARRCRRREEEFTDSEAGAADAFETIAQYEAERVLHEELLRLPAKYRAPLLLCYLEGKSREEAAAELGCTLGMLKGRLERGRNRLRLRLSMRGVSLSAAVAGSCAPWGTTKAAVSTSLVATTVQTVTAWSGGTPVHGSVNPQVLALANGEISMTTSVTMCTAAGVLAAATLGIYALLRSDDALADPPRLAPLVTNVAPEVLATPLPLFILAEIEGGGDAEGGGLNRPLPPDGSWAQYRLELSRTQGGAQRGTTLILTIASVGQTMVDEWPARFLELTIDEGETVQRTKVLVPEEAFVAKESPVHRIIRAWSQRGSDAARQIENPIDDFKRGPLETLFPGELRNAKSLGENQLEVEKLGAVTAKGITGNAKLTDGRGADELVYRAWSHPQVPFGLISAEIKEVSPDRAADRSMKLTLVKFGTDAESKLPDLQ
jgi:hypothetical protein